MAAELAEAVGRLNLASASLDDKADDWIDSILDEQRPRKRVKQDPTELKYQLEQNFLTPSPSFSTSWLNKLQQYVPCMPSM